MLKNNKFLFILMLTFVTLSAYAVSPQPALKEKTEQAVFIQQELKKADDRFTASYQKEFGAKGYAVIFSQRSQTNSVLEDAVINLQLHITPAAAQACWQEMKNAKMVNVHTAPIPAEARARREYLRLGGSLTEIAVGNIKSLGTLAGLKKAGTFTAVFTVEGVTNGVLARVKFPGDLTSMHLDFLRNPHSVSQYAQVAFCPSIPAHARAALLNRLPERDKPVLKLK